MAATSCGFRIAVSKGTPTCCSASSAFAVACVSICAAMRRLASSVITSTLTGSGKAGLFGTFHFPFIRGAYFVWCCCSWVNPGAFHEGGKARGVSLLQLLNVGYLLCRGSVWPKGSRLRPAGFGSYVAQPHVVQIPLNFQSAGRGLLGI